MNFQDQGHNKGKNQPNKQQQNQPYTFPVSLNHGSSLWSGNKDSLGKMKFFQKKKNEVQNTVVLKSENPIRTPQSVFGSQ